MKDRTGHLQAIRRTTRRRMRVFAGIAAATACLYVATVAAWV
jgi:hypothetical protein